MLNSKILITGVSGFIGSHIAEKLLQNNHKVLGIDNFSNPYPKSIFKWNLNILEKSRNFLFYKINILDNNLINLLIDKEKPDFIVHCAAKTGIRESLINPLSYAQTNIIGTQNILEAVRLYSKKTKLILLSSSSVYGIQNEIPLIENMNPNPISPYGFSKYSMELLAQQYFNLYNIPIVIVRPFSIYGPRGRINMAPFLVIKAAETNQPFIQYGNNDNKRDWTYIDDFVDGIFKLITIYPIRSFEIFNFGNNNPIGINDFVKLAKKMVKIYLYKDLDIIHKERLISEIPITCASLDKVKAVIEYNPKINFKRGLDKFFKYYKRNKKLYEKVL